MTMPIVVVPDKAQGDEGLVPGSEILEAKVLLRIGVEKTLREGISVLVSPVHVPCGPPHSMNLVLDERLHDHLDEEYEEKDEHGVD